jgi:hypothetical protein
MQLGDFPSPPKTGNRSTGRSSDLWINRLSAPSRTLCPLRIKVQWHIADIVPTHSGGTAPDLHRLPFQGLVGHRISER